ncbi:hypothetical protein OFR34_14300 [Brachyspira hyodysenteriae]|nr:hypothetical protein [Brachyspira hyodysenteriae]MDA0002095.1 hypothetical protein [Brachyspira hyodysenteriae]
MKILLKIYPINIQAVPEALTLESDKPNVDIRADENDTVVLTSNADEITSYSRASRPAVF